jgi:hypothetical protein
MPLDTCGRSNDVARMADCRIGIVRKARLEAMVRDPDDHRPNTMWRVAVDPGTGGRTAELSFLEILGPTTR